MTTIHINPSDERRIAGNVNRLVKDFESFDKQHNVAKQIDTWSKTPTVRQHEAAIQGDLNRLGAQLERNNNISGWAKNNNIEKRIEAIADKIEKSVKVTQPPSFVQTDVSEMTTIHIDAADEQRIAGNVGKLVNDAATFDQQHGISKDIESWSKSSTVQQHEAAI